LLTLHREIDKYLSTHLRTSVVQQGIRTSLQKIDSNQHLVSVKQQEMEELDTRISTLNNVIHIMSEWRTSGNKSIRCQLIPETKYGSKYVTIRLKNDSRYALSNWTSKIFSFFFYILVIVTFESIESFDSKKKQTKVFSFPINEFVAGSEWREQIKMTVSDYKPIQASAHLSFCEGDIGIAICLLKQRLNVLDFLSTNATSFPVPSFNDRLRSLLLQKWSGSTTRNAATNSIINSFKFDCFISSEAAKQLQLNWNTLFKFAQIDQGTHEDIVLHGTPLTFNVVVTLRTHLNDAVMFKIRPNEDGSLLNVSMQSENYAALVYVREAFLSRLDHWRKHHKVAGVSGQNDMERLIKFMQQHQDRIVKLYDDVNELYATRRNLLSGEEITSVPALLQQLETTYQNLKEMYSETRKYIHTNVHL
jgi:hypothetical protein